jgi:hypothetical protein
VIDLGNKGGLRISLKLDLLAAFCPCFVSSASGAGLGNGDGEALAALLISILVGSSWKGVASGESVACGTSKIFGGGGGSSILISAMGTSAGLDPEDDCLLGVVGPSGWILDGTLAFVVLTVDTSERDLLFEDEVPTVAALAGSGGGSLSEPARVFRRVNRLFKDLWREGFFPGDEPND